MLIALVIVGAFYYKNSLKDTVIEQKKTFLNSFSINKNKIEEISMIGSKGVLGVVKQKGEDFWTLKKPEGARVDKNYVSLLLETLMTLAPEVKIPKEQVSSKQGIYGLKPPQLIVTAKFKDEKKIFSFGKINKISGGRYFQIENDASIYLVPETIFSIFDKTSAEIREVFTVQYNSEEIDSLVVQAQGKTPFILNKTQENENDLPVWSIRANGSETLADGDLVRKSLQKLTMLRAEEFIDNGADRLPFFGLSQPLLTLRVAKKHKSEVSIFGKGVTAYESEDKQVGVGVAYYQKIAGSPWIYRVQREPINAFLKGANSFRAKNPFASLSEPDLRLLFIKTEAGDIRISRQSADSKWLLEIKKRNTKQFVQKKEINAEKLSTWLENLFSLEVVSFDSDKGNSSFVMPYLEIRFTLFSSEANIRSGRLKIGKKLKTSSSSKGSEVDVPRDSVIRIENEPIQGSSYTTTIGAILSGDSVAKLNVLPDYFSKD